MTSDFFSYFPLRRERAHEVCGPAATTFAAILAGQRDGVVLWLSESSSAEGINPLGLSRYFDPHKLLLAKGRDQIELLASAEEALRSSEVSLVVLELSKPLSLTAGRRLQLAAKLGKSAALSIIPVGMGSNAAETRWQCAPIFDPADSTLQRWQLIKNKSGTLDAWDVRWDAETRRIIVVSKTGQRPGSAGAPD